ncbi:MAG TPA: hypothetical protein VFJ67_05395 [Thermodesulfobacteriota bacterium]|nr:hypothetical protein [Thermodesulfobacteriota bacterium]
MGGNWNTSAGHFSARAPTGFARLFGGCAEFRKIDLAAAINRLRTLEIEQK